MDCSDRATHFKLTGQALLACLLLTLCACKLQIDVPEGGAVASESGEHQCDSGQSCLIDVSDLEFDQSFLAQPAEGYRFTGWRKAKRYFCGGKAGTCRLATSGFSSNPLFESFLGKDNEVFFLAPVFEREDAISTAGLATINRGTGLKAGTIAVEAIALVELAESLWADVHTSPVRIPKNGIRETVSGSGGGTAEVYLQDATEGFVSKSRAEITYRNFSEGGVTVNGKQIQIRAELPPYGDSSSPVSGPMEFQRLRISSGGSQIEFHGLLDARFVKLTPIEKQWQQIANFTVTDVGTAETLQLENFRFLYDNITRDYSFITHEIDGFVSSPGLGKIHISTLRPLVGYEYDDRGGYWTSAADGALKIQGRNKSMRLVELNPRYAALQLDEDGDGLYETSKRVEKAVLYGKKQNIEEQQNRPPFANPGEHFRTRAGNETVLYGSYSHDPDGDWLDIRWQPVHKPFASNLPMGERREAEFRFVPDIRGDYIFRVTVSDGIFSRERIIHIRPISTSGGRPPVVSPNPQPEVTFVDSENNEIHIDASGAARYESNAERDTVKWLIPRASDSGSSLAAGRETFRNRLGFDPAYSGEVNVRFNSDFSESSLQLYPGNPIFTVRASGSGAAGGFTAFDTADLNGDGLEDIAAVQYSADGHTVQVWINKGRGEFDVQPTSAPGELAIYAEDFNGDGLADIVSADEEFVYVMLQRSPGKFGEPIQLSIQAKACRFPTGQRLLQPIDLLGDGHLDLIFLDGCDRASLIEQNSAGEFFNAISLQLDELETRYFYVGDFAGDHLPDIVAYRGPDTTPGEISVWENVDGTFLPPRQLIAEVRGASPVLDIDGDSIDDIVVVSPGSVGIYRQDENRNLELIKSTDSGLSSFSPSMLISDLDEDGDIDIAVAGSSDLHIIRQDQNGFSIEGPYSIGSNRLHRQQFVSIDYNGDGHKDLLLPGIPTVLYGKLSFVSTDPESAGVLPK